MKWFKHFTSDMNDKFIQGLIETFGGDGYLAYFGLISLICADTKTGINDRTSFSFGFLKKNFNISRKKMLEIFCFCQTFGKFSYDNSEDFISFSFPKIVEMQDDWTKRLRSSSVVTPKKRSHEVEVEVDVEVDVNKEKNKTYTSKAQKNALSPAREKIESLIEIPRVKKTFEREEWFAEDWESYPRKAGNKKKALAVYLKTVFDPKRREAFREKLRRYVESQRDPQFLKHAETFFRNWENIEVEVTADEEARTRWDKQCAANNIILEEQKKQDAKCKSERDDERAQSRGDATPATQPGGGTGNIELPVEGQQVDLSGEDYYHAGRILQRMQSKTISGNAEPDRCETAD